MAPTLPAAPVLVERDRARHGDVQRLRAPAQRDRRRLVAGGDDVLRQALRARRRGRSVTGTPGLELARAARRPCETSATRFPRRLVEPGQRHAEDRAGRGPQRLRARRIGATRARARPKRRTRPRSARSCPRLPGSATRQSESDSGSTPRGSDVAPEDAHHPRRVRPSSRPSPAAPARRPRPARSSSTGSTPASSAACDEILALDDEQPLLLALAPRLEQPVDQPQLRIGRGGDHSSHSSHAPWKSAWPANSRSPPGQ